MIQTCKGHSVCLARRTSLFTSFVTNMGFPCVLLKITSATMLIEVHGDIYCRYKCNKYSQYNSQNLKTAIIINIIVIYFIFFFFANV